MDAHDDTSAICLPPWQSPANPGANPERMGAVLQVNYLVGLRLRLKIRTQGDTMLRQYIADNKWNEINACSAI